MRGNEIDDGLDELIHSAFGRGQPVPPTVMRSISRVGWPTPTGTPWQFLPQVPTPVSSFMSLPTIFTRLRSVGPLPFSMAPFSGAPSLSLSSLSASVTLMTYYLDAISTCDQ